MPAWESEYWKRPSSTRSTRGTGIGSRSTTGCRLGVGVRLPDGLQNLQNCDERRAAETVTSERIAPGFGVFRAGSGLAKTGGMPRRRRIVIQGLTLHVTHRGNNRCATFREDSDFESFLASLALAIRRYQFHVHAYALMSNHFHLMVTPGEPGGLSRGMQSLGRRYVRYFNDRHNRSGTLWEGRFRTAIITDERYWLTCLRYVEMNPVRAGLASSPEAYRWSSYRSHALGMADPIVAPHAVFDALANTIEGRRRAWRQMCAVPVGVEHLDGLRRSIASGIVATDDEQGDEVCDQDAVPD